MRPISLVLLVCMMFGGCASLVSRQSAKLANNLAAAILDNDDLETVKVGAPAYLIMIDGMIASDPDSEPLLRSGANLNAVYASIFVTEPERQKRLTTKALGYARRALCRFDDSLCDLQTLDFNTFATRLQTLPASSVPSLYSLGATWAGWIQVHRDNWDAVAQLARVQAILQQVVALDETYQQGVAHLYLGGLNTLLPPALGGKPEVGREHFERAIALSNGHNLMAKVLYADRYARLTFNQQLHDQLLNEVLATSPNIKGHTLMNTLAQQQARELLATSDDYF